MASNAWARSNEAALVDELRGSADTISLVATVAGRVVGHVPFTPVQVGASRQETSAVGLRQMAVLPEYQPQGIGSHLVCVGLDACRSQGHGLVVVVRHSTFYPKFGFVKASIAGLEYEHGRHGNYLDSRRGCLSAFTAAGRSELHNLQ